MPGGTWKVGHTEQRSICTRWPGTSFIEVSICFELILGIKKLWFQLLQPLWWLWPLWLDGKFRLKFWAHLWKRTFTSLWTILIFFTMHQTILPSNARFQNRRWLHQASRHIFLELLNFLSSWAWLFANAHKLCTRLIDKLARPVLEHVVQLGFLQHLLQFHFNS